MDDALSRVLGRGDSGSPHAKVASRRDDEPYRRDVVLRLWRPCTVFLLAIAMAALPMVFTLW